MHDLDSRALARWAVEQCDRLADYSELDGALYRSLGRAPLERAARHVEARMRDADLDVERDPFGTVVGIRRGRPGGPTLYLGSHLDTVPDGGAYDGALGVVLPIALCHALGDLELPFDLAVLGFLAEEGCRYGTGCLSARAFTGRLDPAALARRDATGLPLAEAIDRHGGCPAAVVEHRPAFDDALGYLEVHIEQAPVLDRGGRAVGIVGEIVGQSRVRLDFDGQADHAGTTDMRDRHDALCAAAEFVTAVERLARSDDELFATVGRLDVSPNVGNVVPGHATVSLDVRHPCDEARRRALDTLLDAARDAAERRGVQLDCSMIGERAAARCDPALVALLEDATRCAERTPFRLPSRAGHDAMVMARVMPMAMLFVRSPGGLSHHPDEQLDVDDVAVALAVLTGFIEGLADQHRSIGAHPTPDLARARP